jgi:hypothetical protein
VETCYWALRIPDGELNGQDSGPAGGLKGQDFGRDGELKGQDFGPAGGLKGQDFGRDGELKGQDFGPDRSTCEGSSSSPIACQPPDSPGVPQPAAGAPSAASPAVYHAAPEASSGCQTGSS